MDFFSSLLANLWAVFLIILFFGGSIFVHELGHFLAARRRGVKVDRFSIGFGPKIVSWMRDGVEYRLSWLPLGGYVALPQLADMRAIEGESAAGAAPLPPVSYGAKMLVFAAGAFCNLVFALVLATVLWLAGRPEPESIATTRIGYVIQKIRRTDGTEVVGPAAKAGLKSGDVILAIDGRKAHNWPEVQAALVLSTEVADSGERTARLTVERDGITRDYIVYPLRVGDERLRRIGVTPAYEPIVDQVRPDSAGAKLGLKVGDRLKSIDGVPLLSLETLSDHLGKNGPAPSQLVVMREGKAVSIAIPAKRAGQAHPLTGVGVTTNWSLLYQNPFDQFYQVVDPTLRTIRSLLHPHGDLSLSNLSGPIGIGRGFWEAAKSDYPFRFAMWFAILLNVSLAIFNLLPIPVLDGGHMLFATVGRLRGRALPASFIAAAQSVFIVLLFSLIIYVSFFDVRRIMRDLRVDTPPKESTAKP